MTGTSIRLPGSTFAQWVDIVDYPVTDDLTTLLTPRVNLTQSLVNDGSGPDATTTGGGSGITFDDASGIFSGNTSDTANSFTVADLDNASTPQTLTAVFLKTALAASFRPVWGTYNGGTNGFSLTVRGAGIGTGALVESTWPADMIDQYIFYAATYSGGVMKSYMGNGGDLQQVPDVAGVKVSSANGARIGGYAGAFTPTVHVGMASKHTSELSRAELLEIYQYATSLMAGAGETLL